MRWRRLPLSSSGFSRSAFVIEKMMVSMRSSAPVSTWPCAMALSPPGKALMSFEMPPILETCFLISRKSFRLMSAFWTRSAVSASISSAWIFEACSISETTSPMPKMRLAMRSGWNGSSESGFSPALMNLIGLPVTCLSDSAPPPRASPSIFDMITPSKSTFSAKAWATFTASWPVMASTTMRI